MPKLLAFLLTNYKFFGISFVHDCPANGALGQSCVAQPNLWLLGSSSTIAVHCLQGSISRGYCSPFLGTQWCKRHVLFRSDNDAVVHMLKSCTSKIPCLMRLSRHLLLSAARHSFSLSAQHVPGDNNQLAILSLVSIGRTSVCWLQRLSPCQLEFLHSS